jgi:hypothetical protein
MLPPTDLAAKSQIGMDMKFTLQFCQYVGPVFEYCNGHFEYDPILISTLIT